MASNTPLFVTGAVIFVFLCTILICETTYQCSPGVYQCHLDQWSPWSQCSSSCGGGSSHRIKGLCCDTKYKSVSDCAVACNLTKNDFIDIKPCGQSCLNGGIFQKTVCQCSRNYTGKCCQNYLCGFGCNHGHCENGTCICSNLFQGKDCSKPKKWLLATTIGGGLLLLLSLLTCVICLCCACNEKRQNEKKVEQSPKHLQAWT